MSLFLISRFLVFGFWFFLFLCFCFCFFFFVVCFLSFVLSCLSFIIYFEVFFFGHLLLIIHSGQLFCLWSAGTYLSRMPANPRGGGSNLACAVRARLTWYVSSVLFVTTTKL